MKKIFLTSGVVLCLACPAFAADTKDLIPQDGGGYLLAGTQNEPNCSTPDTLKYADAPTTFYAKWQPRTDLTVTYKPGASGVTPNSDQVTKATYDAAYTVLANTAAGLGAATLSDGETQGQAYTKKGYRFTNWVADYDIGSGEHENTDYTGAVNATIEQYKVSADNVDMVAQWTPLTYDVIYNVGNHAAANAEDYTDENGLIFDTPYTAKAFNVSPISTYMSAADGYTFRGWSLDEDSVYVPNGNNSWMWQGTTLSVTTDDNDLAEYAENGYNVYAIYSANGYTLTYNCGQFSNDKKAKFGDTNDQTTSSNYTFETTSIESIGDPSANCSLLGYHVVEDAWTCYKTGDKTTTYTYAQVVNSAGNGKWNIANDVTCEVSEWTPNIIGLGWDAGTGAKAADGVSDYAAGANTDTCTYDDVINIGAKPSKPGYNFVGWTTDPNYTSQSGYVIFKTSPDVGTGTTVTSEGD